MSQSIDMVAFSNIRREVHTINNAGVLFDVGRVKSS